MSSKKRSHLLLKGWPFLYRIQSFRPVSDCASSLILRAYVCAFSPGERSDRMSVKSIALGQGRSWPTVQTSAEAVDWA